MTRSVADQRVDRTIRALADPHRRALLDALRRDGRQSVTALGAVVPEVGRHAVLKHVAVLAEAGLVHTEKSGRQRLVSLNAVPIVELADRWLDEYGVFAGAALVQLRQHLESVHHEGEQGMSETTGTVIASVVIEARAEQVWRAIVDPEQTRRWFFGGSVRSGWHVGDPIEWIDEGNVLIAGEILAYEDGSRLVHTFRAIWSAETAADPASQYEWLVESVSDDLTRVTIRHTGIPAGTATAEQVETGNTTILSSLKTYVETGRTMSGMG